MTYREEARAQLLEIALNEPEKLVHTVEVMSDRMHTLQLLADSSMEVGTVLAWPMEYPKDVRERAFELSARALAELDEILEEVVDEDE